MLERTGKAISRQALALMIGAACGAGVLVTSLAPVQAQVPPSLSVDRPEYLPGDTVTFTGAGFDCDGVVGMRLSPPDTFLQLAIPDLAGSFQGTFVAPSVGSYVLLADGDPCSATATVEVVDTLTTTTTTIGPTTSTTVVASSTTIDPSPTSSVVPSSTTPSGALPSGGALPPTGASDPALTAAAAGALVVGCLLILLTRRRAAH